MEKIAFIYGEVFVYWSSILLTLGAAAAICVFLSLYLGNSGNAAAAAVCVPLALALSLALARLVHWYCRADSYAGLADAMTRYSTGGLALMGAFGGCALAAAVLRILGISRNLPEMLDCMSLAGGAGIAIGRLSAFFNTSDRGFLTEPGKLPWISAVINPVSGAVEYRLATFLLQAMAAGVIFLVLLAFYLAVRKNHRYRDGDTCILFLLCYGVSQVLLDSTRYDSLFFRSNGFVSIVQVLGALAIGLAAAVFSVRLVKNRGFRRWYMAMWLGIAALLGLGGYMEYYVQRHGRETAFAYSVMGGCLLGLIVLILLIRRLAAAAEEKSLLQPEEMVWRK